MSDIWTDALEALKPRVDPQTFEVWLAPLRLVEVRDDVLEIAGPSRFHCDWFESNYQAFALEALAGMHGRSFHIQMRVIETAAPAPAPSEAAHAREVERELPPPPTGLYPRYRFENFVKGGSNEVAVAAALAAAENPGGRFNPLFIYGGVGLGKTHLLHAVGHMLHAAHPEMRIVYLSAEQFMNEFVSAVRHNQFDQFRARYRTRCDCLLIDDIQFIAGRDRTMDEFFHVFNALYEAGKQIVVTADRVPAEMEGMEQRVTSRLNWGLVTDVQAPDLETRVAIVQAKAERDAIEIRESVALLLAELVSSNVRELEGALLRVSAFAQLRGRALDEEFVREVLGKNPAPVRPVVTVESVQKAVASYYSVRIAELKGKRRHTGIVRPRHVAMYLSRELTGASFPDIALRFGGKDHSTVINACNRIAAKQGDDPKLRDAIAALRAQLTGPG